MLKTPVVLLGRVQVSVRAKEAGTAVSLGKWVRRGLITGGAPERKYLWRKERKVREGARAASDPERCWGGGEWVRGKTVGTSVASRAELNGVGWGQLSDQTENPHLALLLGLLLASCI